MDEFSSKDLRKRRNVFVAILITFLLAIGLGPGLLDDDQPFETGQIDVLSDYTEGTEIASEVLESLDVKGRAPKTGYSRSEFGSGWARVEGCDMRNIILQRQLTNLNVADDGCVVLSGDLQDPYTAKNIEFVRGSTTSDDVQIDHVVALSDSWQKGAQQLEYGTREKLANDPLNLLAVDGPANQEKGDSDAASWLPTNKSFRCRYVARQVAVKAKYSLWVTEAEKSSMKRILNGCEDQVVPVVL